MNSLSLKKGDTVVVLAGRDRGKRGKIVNVDRKRFRLTVEGVNLRVRHQRARRQGQKGQKVTLPYPLHPAKVMLICPNCGKPTRIGHLLNEAGSKLRTCKKCKASF